MEQHPIPCVTPASGDPVPDSLRNWLGVLQPCFTALSWERVLVIVMGAVLAPGKRTITACLRMTGRVDAGDFASYHQLLNRARWRSLAMTQVGISVRPRCGSSLLRARTTRLVEGASWRLS